MTWRAGIATFEEQYKHYYGLEFWLVCKLEEFTQQKYLAAYADLFDADDYHTLYWLVKPAGIQKLLAEWPQIAAKFGITQENAAG